LLGGGLGYGGVDFTFGLGEVDETPGDQAYGSKGEDCG
jgi:hypothetical protein